jgi:tetratricopeptide (TPR) repeat protein
MGKAASASNESETQQLARQAAAEFALAIKKSNGNNPEAHALLGFAHQALGDRKRAIDEFNIATTQNPHNLRASMGRQGYLLWDYSRAWEFYQKTAPQSGYAKSRSIKEVLLPAAKDYQNELNRTIQSFLAEFSQSNDVEFCIDLAQRMFSVAEEMESLDDVPVDVMKSKDIYKVIYDAPWNTKNHTGHESEVQEILRRAEGSHELRQSIAPQSTISQWQQTATNERVLYETQKAAGCFFGVIWEMVKAFFGSIFR